MRRTFAAGSSGSLAGRDRKAERAVAIQSVRMAAEVERVLCIQAVADSV